MSEWKTAAVKTLIRFSGDAGGALTNGKTVLQPVDTRLRVSGVPRAWLKWLQERGVEVDDTPVMESFAEGYQHA